MPTRAFFEAKFSGITVVMSRAVTRISISVVVLLASAFLFTYAAAPSSVDRLHAHVTWLADSARQGRRAGTSGAVDAANYISDQFRSIGFDVQMQEFGGNRRNVVARYGTSFRTIVAGAHYDGQGPGFPSASDNAAGVAILIELARDLKTQNLPASLVMVAFDDEEQGLNGSTYFANHAPMPLDNVFAAVVFDALGRHFIDLREWTMIVLGTEYSTELSSVMRKHNRNDMLTVGTDLIGPRSDFAPFAFKRVPFLFFSDGTYEDYHGSGDTADRVDYTRLAGETKLIGEVIHDVALLKTKPRYHEDPVYPANEMPGMLKLMAETVSEKKNFPRAYRLVFDDLKTRIPMDTGRTSTVMAMSALLAAATPAHARYFLQSELEPYYESMHKPDIATALQEESARSGQ